MNLLKEQLNRSKDLMGILNEETSWDLDAFWDGIKDIFTGIEAALQGFNLSDIFSGDYDVMGFIQELYDDLPSEEQWIKFVNGTLSGEYLSDGVVSLINKLSPEARQKVIDALKEYHRLKEEGMDGGDVHHSLEGYRIYPVSLTPFTVEVRDEYGKVDETMTYLANNYLRGGTTKKLYDLFS